MPDDLTRFRDGPSVMERWVAARDLMAARKLIPVLDTPEFHSGFAEVAKEAHAGEDIYRLIAVDLVIRLSSFAKKLAPVAQSALRDALANKLPPASLLTDAKNLPAGAKPAGFRENIALSLQYASGDWVIPYVLRALVEEDRSQRSRLELVRQLATREPSIDRWLDLIIAQPIRKILGANGNLEIAAARLRDLTAAIADVVNQNRARLSVTEHAAQTCAALCDLVVPISRNTRLPKNLGQSAAEVSRLLDEIFAAKLTLIVEPAAYAVLEVFDRWWRPLPYPKPVQTALDPIVDKLVTGITLRARWGQQSEMLAIRLRQALGDKQSADKRVQQIAQEESGLSPDMDDWLRGRQRREAGESVSQRLRSIESEDLTASIALILLDSEQLLRTVEGENSSEPGMRLANAIRSLASQRGLEIVGHSGQIVEYFPVEHETLSGSPPSELRVKIVRPLVVRQRHDGSRDIVLRALVTDAN